MKKAREGGKEALKTSPRPGRPPKLSEEERSEELPSLLEKGPEHFGFRGDVWTRKRVRKIIKEKSLLIRVQQGLSRWIRGWPERLRVPNLLGNVPSL